MHAYWRTANYLSVGQIYLMANPLLKEPLQLKHVKPRLLGHWGTTSGQNFLYVHLNRVIKLYDLNMLYISGPGHGGPALVANAYLEGTYSEVYPNIGQDEAGLKRLFTQFSFPGGIPSHVAPETPGSIHEGGELGYALSHAYGAAFDNPDLIVACVVGDGKAETGPLATGWHGNKFLNPVHDGCVLPILHLNGYKIANPAVLARISHEELDALMRGYGYTPHFVEGDDPAKMHQLLAGMGPEALRTFCDVIREFTQSIGKERFLLAREISGGREHAWEVVEKTGLDAALGIEDVPGKLEGMVTGCAEPADYFSVFRNWILDSPNGHRWHRNQVITLVDEHDQVRKRSHKYRFCGDIRFRDLAFNVMAVQLTTMGIPCIYYGSEQGFDSGGRPNGSDLVLRENMFGGRFGGLCTQGRHFFNEDGDLHRALAALIDLRKKLLPLRRGRQSAASRLGRRRYLQPSAPSWQPHAIARVLVAPLHRPRSPDRNEHQRGAAGHRLFDGCAYISRRGRPVLSDLLLRPEECCATSLHLDCRM